MWIISVITLLMNCIANFYLLNYYIIQLLFLNVTVISNFIVFIMFFLFVISFFPLKIASMNKLVTSIILKITKNVNQY